MIFFRVQPADIANAHAESGRFIDFGYREGSFSTTLAKGFVPYGVKISPYFAARANECFAPKYRKAVQMAAGEESREFPNRFFAAAILHSFPDHDANTRDGLVALRKKNKTQRISRYLSSPPRVIQPASDA